MFEGLGIWTLDADSVGHEILAGPGLSEVAERWPEVVVNGEINRKALARIVFADLEALAELEAITHPLIFSRIESYVETVDGIAVVEAPLIGGFGGWPRVVVDASDDKRFERAVGRGMDTGDVSRRMAAQPSRSRWLANADLVIPNHGSIDALKATVSKLVPLLFP